MSIFSMALFRSFPVFRFLSVFSFGSSLWNVVLELQGRNSNDPAAYWLTSLSVNEV